MNEDCKFKNEDHLSVKAARNVNKLVKRNVNKLVISAYSGLCACGCTAESTALIVFMLLLSLNRNNNSTSSRRRGSRVALKRAVTFPLQQQSCIVWYGKHSPHPECWSMSRRHKVSRLRHWLHLRRWHEKDKTHHSKTETKKIETHQWTLVTNYKLWGKICIWFEISECQTFESIWKNNKSNYIHLPITVENVPPAQPVQTEAPGRHPTRELQIELTITRFFKLYLSRRRCLQGRPYNSQQL